MLRFSGLKARKRIRAARVALAVLTVALTSSSIGWGGNSDYEIVVTGGNTSQGAELELDVLFNLNALPLESWSYGICHSTNQLSLTSVVDGSFLATVNLGGPPAFDSLNFYPSGFTKAVVISFMGADVLPAQTNLVVSEMVYQVIGTPGTTVLAPCSVLGSPAVAVRMTTTAGVITPDVEAGVVEIFPGNPPVVFDLVAEVQATGLYDPIDGIGTATAKLSIRESALNQGALTGVEAFSFRAAINPTLADVTGIGIAPDLSQINAGAGPDLFVTDILAEGVTVDVVVDNQGVDTILLDSPLEAALVTIDSLPGSLVFNPFGLTVPIEFDTDFPTPIENRVEADAAVVLTDTFDGSFRFVPRKRFRRGDANDDGLTDIADVIRILESLFEGVPVNCRDSTDTNDDNSYNIADAAQLLEVIFLGAPLPAPAGNCDWDQTGVSNCLSFNSCP